LHDGRKEVPIVGFVGFVGFVGLREDVVDLLSKKSVVH